MRRPCVSGVAIDTITICKGEAMSPRSSRHFLKCHDVYYDAIKRGDKRFEIRSCHDRDFRPGDTLVLTRMTQKPRSGVWVPTLDESGEQAFIEVRVLYLLSGFPGIEADHVVMSIELMEAT
jgi:hypothetical protein